MARKHLTVGEFALFDVLYEDGTQSSNRKVPVAALGGLDGDAPAREIIEAQDRKIGEASGKPRPKIKSIARAGAAARQYDGGHAGHRDSREDRRPAKNQQKKS